MSGGLSRPNGFRAICGKLEPSGTASVSNGHTRSSNGTGGGSSLLGDEAQFSMVSAPVIRQHLNGLTGLRFWAAAFVMLYHFNSYLGTIPVLSEFVRFGTAGVAFFFVLSGFVLAWTYHDVRVPNAVFYWRRFARIWPLHILTTIISLICWRLVSHPIGDAINVETLWPAFFLLHAWASDFRVLQGGSGASWSLSAEAFFYALFPLMLILITRIESVRRILWIPAICTVVMFLIWLLIPEQGIGDYARGTLLAYFPATRVMQFIAGVALGVAMKRGWMPKFGYKASAVALVAFFGAMHIWSENVERTSMWYPQNASQLFSIVPFAMLIVVVAKSDLLGAPHVFKGRVIELLGQASFALYLIHVPAALLWTYFFGKPETIGVTITAWVVVSIGANAFAIGLYKFFERPVEKWLRPMVSGQSKETSDWRVAGTGNR